MSGSLGSEEAQCPFCPIHSFTNGCTGLSLVGVGGLPLVLVLSLWQRALGHLGFSSCCVWAQWLSHTGFVARGMWNPPGPGINLVSPASTGRFLTTGQPGKFLGLIFLTKADNKADSDSRTEKQI